MKKKALVFLIIAMSFNFGFAFNSVFAQTTKEIKMKRVTSIGGIFFKCKDPKKMNEWYKTHLGLNTSPYGAKVEWQQEEPAKGKGYTLWTPFAEDTKYFGTGTQAYMFNFRVADIEALVAELKKEGVTVLDEIEASDYGKFVHIQDIEGNKVELWEPK